MTLKHSRSNGKKQLLPSNVAELPVTPGTLPARLLTALIENPDYCSIAEVASILRRSKSAVYEFYSDIESINVYGIRLYRRDAVFARKKLRGLLDGSRIVVTGIEVARLRHICEQWYRQNFDIAEPAMKRLAKRIARL